MASNARRNAMAADIELLDLAPDTDTLLADVLAGLSGHPKSLPCKYFYDDRGAELFEQICRLPEYYPTRTELGILKAHLPEIAGMIGADCAVIEPGSGSGIKTRLLLDALDSPAAYVPIDVACEQLVDNARCLAAAYPATQVLPVCADFSQPIELPASLQRLANKLIYFPGSTIGNFSPQSAVALLRRWRQLLGVGGALLIGVDLKKEVAVLEAAYNDSQGVTAAFNLNLLQRLNRELDADFDLSAYTHHADYDPAASAVRMWLVSQRPQQVRINGSRKFDFAAGERICTEHSYKYSLEEVGALARQSAWTQRGIWTDMAQQFSVHLLTIEA